MLLFAVQVTEVHSGKSDICREILDDLPEWFGIPDAKAAYVAAASNLPMLGCHNGQEFIAFVSLKLHTARTAELYVLGVKRRFHRRGVGRALMDTVLSYAEKEKLCFLTVKTLAPSCPDPHYAATRKFYEAVGFEPLEVLPTLWGPGNPCLLMVRLI